MNGCNCGCRGPRFGSPTREDRVRWLQDYQRDLEQQMAEVAEEIRRLQEAQQSASWPVQDGIRLWLGGPRPA